MTTQASNGAGSGCDVGVDADISSNAVGASPAKGIAQMALPSPASPSTPHAALDRSGSFALFDATAASAAKSSTPDALTPPSESQTATNSSGEQQPAQPPAAVPPAVVAATLTPGVLPAATPATDVPATEVPAATGRRRAHAKEKGGNNTTARLSSVISKARGTGLKQLRKSYDELYASVSSAEKAINIPQNGDHERTYSKLVIDRGDFARWALGLPTRKASVPLPAKIPESDRCTPLSKTDQLAAVEAGKLVIERFTLPPIDDADQLKHVRDIWCFIQDLDTCTSADGLALIQESIAEETAAWTSLKASLNIAAKDLAAAITNRLKAEERAREQEKAKSERDTAAAAVETSAARVASGASGRPGCHATYKIMQTPPPPGAPYHFIDVALETFRDVKASPRPGEKETLNIMLREKSVTRFCTN